MADGRSLALRAIKTVAAAGDRVRPPSPGVVVLIYHRVGGGSGTEVDLSPTAFDEQMAWLAASGRVIGLDAAVDLLDPASGTDGSGDNRRGDGGSGRGDAAPGAGAGRTAPDDPVVVTFDDGTADLADVATPILVRHGVPATVYLATRYVDEGIAFPDDGTPLSWSAVRDMASTGLVTFGSHTHGHLLLDRLPPVDAAGELDRSRTLIEDALGAPADHFAYPKAVAASPEVEPLVRERFRSAALGGNRPNPVGRTDLHRLSRTAVQVSDGSGWFVRKARGGMALEDSIRRAVNRVRYRAAVG
ncbi:MAG TPA: polysaccharide deacetylase family protein [Acidimicrobiales bacterium]|nr:polysaccharide deacetylase family protein [Acidimicrobiales bacterium]